MSTVPDSRTYSSAGELEQRQQMLRLMDASPIPDEQRLSNLGLFLNRQSLSRILFMQELYTLALGVHGIIIEFGVRWGQNLALFTALRGIHEPYNFNRKIVGFDTFAGFPTTSEQDGASDLVQPGGYGVSAGYSAYLEQVLQYHEQECPLAHIRKHELVEGDACETLPAYLEEHPETVIALAYFDFDLYEPTRRCLECIRPHLTRGTVIGFDELNCREFPGETLALKEVLGLDRYSLRRTPHNPSPSYLVID